MIKRFLLSTVLFLLPMFAHADWAADRDASAGYVTVTTLATAVDEAVPFAVVYLSDLPADFHTAMTAASDTDGKTIRVSTSDGTTQLACVPIGVNTSTDTGCLIFLGTGMSASVDVDYRIYVGNAALTMPAASAAEQLVFAAYAGVYFPGVDTRDWTSGGRTLTAVNSPGTAASGYEGITAATYNGSSSYHKYEGTWPHAFPLTAEGPSYATNTTTDGYVAGLGSSTDNDPFAHVTMFGSSQADKIGGVFRGQAGSLSTAVSANAFSAATWYYVAANRDALTGTSIAYIDGAGSGSNTTALTTTPSYDRLAIGCLLRATATTFLNGRVAVALLSASVRSADYVSTMQDNWAGTMYSAGAWTPASSTCNSGSTGWVLFGTVSQSTSAGADWATLTNALDDDADAATVSLDDGGVYESEYLNFTNITYGTQPPVGADSYTISARIKRSGQTNTGKEINDLTVQFIDETGTRVGSNAAATSTQWPSIAANAVPDYVFTGFTPDGGDFDADSGIALRATGINTNGATTASVLTVWIKIDWTCPSTIETASGFFGLED